MAHLLYQFHVVHRVIFCALSVKFLVYESRWYALLAVRRLIWVRDHNFLKQCPNCIELVPPLFVHLISFDKGHDIQR